MEQAMYALVQWRDVCRMTVERAVLIEACHAMNLHRLAEECFRRMLLQSRTRLRVVQVLGFGIEAHDKFAKKQYFEELRQEARRGKIASKAVGLITVGKRFALYHLKQNMLVMKAKNWGLQSAMKKAKMMEQSANVRSLLYSVGSPRKASRKSNMTKALMSWRGNYDHEVADRKAARLAMDLEGLHTSDGKKSRAKNTIMQCLQSVSSGAWERDAKLRWGIQRWLYCAWHARHTRVVSDLNTTKSASADDMALANSALERANAELHNVAKARRTQTEQVQRMHTEMDVLCKLAYRLDERTHSLGMSHTSMELELNQKQAAVNHTREQLHKLSQINVALSERIDGDASFHSRGPPSSYPGQRSVPRQYNNENPQYSHDSMSREVYGRVQSGGDRFATPVHSEYMPRGSRGIYAGHSKPEPGFLIGRSSSPAASPALDPVRSDTLTDAERLADAEFDALDVNGDGVISREEFRTLRALANRPHHR